jgi:uncharacterized phage protein (TIGR02218 family)
MRAVSPALLAHMAGGSTTLARCWKCTRLDGQVLGFTSVDRDIVFGGVTYLAATGFTPSAIEHKLDLSVQNLEVHGFLDSAAITERDLLAGLWDGCSIEIFEINFSDLTQGRMLLGAGKLGNVNAGRTAFMAELRGITQALQQPTGDYYTLTCLAQLGDARCSVNVEALRVAGTVTGVSDRSAFASSVTGPTDYYGAGIVAWVTGLNAGIKVEAASFDAGAFVLSIALPFNIAAGDTFAVIPGCRHRLLPDCKAKFNNVVNFRGFPHVPLNDFIVGQSALAR